MAPRGRRYRGELTGHRDGRLVYALSSQPTTSRWKKGDTLQSVLVGHRDGRPVYASSQDCTRFGIRQPGELVGHRNGRLVYAISDNCAFGSYGSRQPVPICYNPVATQEIGAGVVVSVMGLDIWYLRLNYVANPQWNKEFWSSLFAMKGVKRYGYPKLWDDINNDPPTVEAIPLFPYPFTQEDPLVMSLSRVDDFDTDSYALLQSELDQVGLIFFGTIFTPHVVFTDGGNDPLRAARFGTCQNDPVVVGMVMDWIVRGGVMVLGFVFTSPLVQD